MFSESQTGGGWKGPSSFPTHSWLRQGHVQTAWEYLHGERDCTTSLGTLWYHCQSKKSISWCSEGISSVSVDAHGLCSWHLAPLKRVWINPVCTLSLGVHTLLRSSWAFSSSTSTVPLAFLQSRQAPIPSSLWPPSSISVSSSCWKFQNWKHLISIFSCRNNNSISYWFRLHWQEKALGGLRLSLPRQLRHN